MNETSVVPINIVNNNDHLVKSRSIHSTSRRNVVKGRGIIIATLAIPQLRENNESSKTKKVWKVLFDSGSDGDIASIRKSEKHPLICINDNIHNGGKPVMASLRPTKLGTCN